MRGDRAPCMRVWEGSGSDQLFFSFSRVLWWMFYWMGNRSRLWDMRKRFKGCVPETVAVRNAVCWVPESITICDLALEQYESAVLLLLRVLPSMWIDEYFEPPITLEWDEMFYLSVFSKVTGILSYEFHNVYLKQSPYYIFICNDVK